MRYQCARHQAHEIGRGADQFQVQRAQPELAPDSPDATGYTALMAQVDTLLIGRSTYDAVLGFEPWPYAGKRVVVLSHRAFVARHGEERREGCVAQVLAGLAAEGRRHVYLDGGAVIRAGLHESVIDSLTLSMLPVVLGKGVCLFDAALPRSNWRLDATRQLPSGVVQLAYSKS
ncbi:deaminase [Janthinobacterium lividum]|uniref:Deaminase n=1 Tax=Janthinobacterium lividum TaxID=29581 RepID=A0A1E8PSG7_9BURK|nr:deaminase [Janthinobacterium lividum]